MGEAVGPGVFTVSLHPKIRCNAACFCQLVGTLL